MSRRTSSLCGLICGCLIVALALVAPNAAATPEWTPVETLSLSGQSAYGAQIAVDPAGNATAVWSRSDGTHTRIQSSRRPVGGSWSSPVDLSASGQNASAPQVAVDAFGSATAVWIRYDGTSERVQSSRRTATGTWSLPVFVSLAGSAGEDATSPQVAVDPAGNATAVWSRYDESGTETRVQSSSRTTSGAWSTPQNRSTAGAGGGYDPKVVVDASGDATVVWYLHPSGPGPDTVQVSQRISGAWSSPLDLSPADGPSYLHQVAVDAEGRATVVWQIDNQTNRIIQSRHQTAVGTWSEVDDLSPAGFNSYDPQVAVDAAGNAVAVWALDNISNNQVQASDRPVGGTWSSPVDLSPAEQNAYSVQVDVNTAGSAVAIWTGSDGVNYIVQSSRRPVGAAWGSTVDVSTFEGSVGNLQVAVDASGDAAAVWVRFDGADDRVEATGLDTVGPVTSTTAPTAASQTGTSFLTKWASKDTWSAVATQDVRYQTAVWNGAFGSPVVWKNATTANSATFAGRAGRTYCFSARSRDVLGNVGAWSGQRCTTTPVDDRTLSASSGWSRLVGSDYFQKTVTSTSKQGAALTLVGVSGKRFALLVATGAGNGTVKVLLNGSSLGTFSLAGTAKKRFLLPVKTFTAVKQGTLKVVVTTSGKPVRIDGVYVAR